MSKTSVIIPCWIKDTTQLMLTQRCISSIKETSSAELIIIDNGSLLGTDCMRSEADIFIRFKKNMGYVRAINEGFKTYTSDYVVAGNNDYFMEKGWDSAMRGVLDNIPEAGIACLHTLGSPKQETCWEEPGTPGGWWMIKRELQELVGFLDPDFFNVFADYDYLWRILKLTGKKVISTPEVSVQHYGEGTLSKFDKRCEEYNRGQWLLINKWKDDPDFEKLVGNGLSIAEGLQWMKDNIEYSKSIDFTS